MTTVIGIADKDAKISILCADRQSTFTNPNNHNPIGKTLGRKIWTSRNGHYAFGHSGRFDESLQKLVSRMVDEQVDVEKVVKDSYFQELRDLNLEALGDRVPDNNQLSGLILITRFQNEPQLYNCFPLGRVENKALTFIGSGSTRAERYFEALETLNHAKDYLPNRTKLNREQRVVFCGLEALRYAQTGDIYSSGLDLVVATPEKIKDHFSELQDDFLKRIKKIVNQYNKKD